MHNPDRMYFSNFAAGPEFESNYEYEDLYDLDFDGNPHHFPDDTDYDDSGEFNWDNV